MKVRAQHTVRTFLVSVLTLTSGYLLVLGLSARNSQKEAGVGLYPKASRDARKSELKKKRSGNAYVVARFQERGFRSERSGAPSVTLVSGPGHNPGIPRSYKSLEEIENQLRFLELKYPKIVHLEKIGQSTAFKLPIWAVKLSDHAATREDEPRILFTGVHHAREPIGANICLNILETMCREYGRDAQVTRWVDSIEIWFVPVVNPDGYKYVLDNNLGFPWWRKNMRDNDGDGLFNPLFDGVDLNRNYDYNWREGGDGKPSSWFYRGRQPFSENETRSIWKLALRENFVVGISYHSYGESILFPWGNYDRPPDLELIMDVAANLARRIRKESGRGYYSVLPLNGRVGQSSIWMYGHLRALDYIVEVGTEYFPADEVVPFILEQQLRGAYYLFGRMLETGVKGYVFDAESHEPLLASVEVRELAADHVRPRMTDPQFGSFYRLLNPGRYSFEIRSEGYLPRVIRNVRVRRGQFAELHVGLSREPHALSNGTNH